MIKTLIAVIVIAVIISLVVMQIKKGKRRGMNCGGCTRCSHAQEQDLDCYGR